MKKQEKTSGCLKKKRLKERLTIKQDEGIVERSQAAVHHGVRNPANLSLITKIKKAANIICTPACPAARGEGEGHTAKGGAIVVGKARAGKGKREQRKTAH